MKKIISYLLFGFVMFTMVSCSVTKGYNGKPTRKQINKGMKYSDWRYYYPTKMYQSNYVNYVNH